MLSLVDIDLASRRRESARFMIGDEEAAQGAPAAVEAMSLLYLPAVRPPGQERVHGVIGNEILMLKWRKYPGVKEGLS
jgi:hypothetical protein